MAEKLEDHKNMVRALQEFKLSTVETAVSLLDSETLYRGEKVKGPAEWLLELQNALKPIPTNNRWLNRVWLSVATAPAGFCHPRSSMIGTLLEDIAAGKSFDEFSRAFKAKMSPIAYQRPQAAPKAGAILQAEKLFQDLQAASALERRWATLDDLKKLWTPNREVFKAGRQCGKTGAVFAHIKAREEAVSVSSVRAPAINITWVKFADKVLPTANKLEVYVNMSDSFCQFVTEANKESTPILQWDFPEARNPVSWYFYNGRSPAVKFHLSGAQFHSVSAVVLRPSMWGETHMEHWGKGVAFVIPECHDMRGECLALFPESLKSEFHGVRSVIEEHMRSAKLSGDRSTAAAGIGKGQTGPGGKWDLRVRVTSKGHIQEYCLERWD